MDLRAIHTKNNNCINYNIVLKIALTRAAGGDHDKDSDSGDRYRLDQSHW